VCCCRECAPGRQTYPFLLSSSGEAVCRLRLVENRKGGSRKSRPERARGKAWLGRRIAVYAAVLRQTAIGVDSSGRSIEAESGVESLRALIRWRSIDARSSANGRLSSAIPQPSRMRRALFSSTSLSVAYEAHRVPCVHGGCTAYPCPALMPDIGGEHTRKRFRTPTPLTTPTRPITLQRRGAPPVHASAGAEGSQIAPFALPGYRPQASKGCYPGPPFPLVRRGCGERQGLQGGQVSVVVHEH